MTPIRRRAATVPAAALAVPAAPATAQARETAHFSTTKTPH